MLINLHYKIQFTFFQEFKTLPHLNYHMKSHTEASRTKCDICGKQFSHIGSLNRHLKAHTSKYNLKKFIR